jgi:hypothetical protein
VSIFLLNLEPRCIADLGQSTVPADDAPRFHKGWIATIVMAILTVLVAIATRCLDYREQRQRPRTTSTVSSTNEESLEDAKTIPSQDN